MEDGEFSVRITPLQKSLRQSAQTIFFAKNFVSLCVLCGKKIYEFTSKLLVIRNSKLVIHKITQKRAKSLNNHLPLNNHQKAISLFNENTSPHRKPKTRPSHAIWGRTLSDRLLHSLLHHRQHKSRSKLYDRNANGSQPSTPHCRPMPIRLGILQRHF